MLSLFHYKTWKHFITCIFYHVAPHIWHRQLRYFLVQDGEIFVLHLQYHGFQIRWQNFSFIYILDQPAIWACHHGQVDHLLYKRYGILGKFKLKTNNSQNSLLVKCLAILCSETWQFKWYIFCDVWIHDGRVLMKRVKEHVHPLRNIWDLHKCQWLNIFLCLMTAV